MVTSVTDGGLLGAIVIALIVYAVMKKSSFNLPDFTKAGTSVADTLGKVYGKLLLFIAGVAVLYWGWGIKVRPAEVGVWGQEYWLQILIVYCLGAGLIWLNADDKTAKTLQKVLAGGAIMLLAVFPMWSWFARPPSASVAQAIQSSKVPRATDPEESWVRLVLSKNEKSELFPLGPNETVRIKGSEFRVHCKYRDHEESYKVGETPCPKGDMLGVSVENEANEKNVILVAYTRI